jgi:AhpD family alkylhydroperoxidase
MSLIPLLDADRAPLTAQAHYADGDPGPIVSSLAHVPELLDATLPFLGAIFGPSALDLRTKEIVVLRTSAMLRCRYCVETHAVVARDAGLRVEEVVALRDPDDGTLADPREAALVAWVDAVALGPGTPPEQVAADLQSHFAEADVVELTLLVGATLMLNRYATSLGLPTSAETLRRLAEEGLA